LKEEAIDRTLWRTRFGRGYGLRNEWTQLIMCEGQERSTAAAGVSCTLPTENVFHNVNIRLNTSTRTLLIVVCFLLGNSPLSEFYMPTFRNSLFHLHRQVFVCGMN
jgi:hypothetical protein